jgi:hypothetical protein
VLMEAKMCVFEMTSIDDGWSSSGLANEKMNKLVLIVTKLYSWTIFEQLTYYKWN